MIVVFADVKTRQFRIYTQGGQEVIDFAEAYILHDLPKDSEILYVTKAMHVKIDDLVQLASSMVPGGAVATDPTLRFIHPTVKGVLRVDDKIIFEGPTDFKTLETLKLQDWHDLPVISKLLKLGLLEIVDAQSARKISHQDTKEKQVKKQKESEEMERRSTVSGKGDVTGDGPMTAGGMAIEGAIEIDLERRGGGSGLGNEGSLVP